jgi:hypothetical protein
VGTVKAWGNASYNVTARGSVEIPLTPPPSARTLESDLARAASGRQPYIQVAGPEPVPEPARKKPVRKARGDAPEHGMRGYERGCRCGECKAAKAVESRKYRERRRVGKVTGT